MTDKLTATNPPPPKAWRVNFHDKTRAVVDSVVFYAPDRDAAWKIVWSKYREMAFEHTPLLEREIPQPSDQEQP